MEEEIFICVAEGNMYNGNLFYDPDNGSISVLLMQKNETFRTRLRMGLRYIFGKNDWSYVYINKKNVALLKEFTQYI